MIDINIRDRNQIITLTSPGKTPIRARRNSPVFYSSMELLCISFGACFSSKISDILRFEEVNPKVLESIRVTMDNFELKVIISHPKDLSADIIKQIKMAILRCEIASLLKCTISVEFIENTTATEELITRETTTCCGGN